MSYCLKEKEFTNITWFLSECLKKDAKSLGELADMLCIAISFARSFNDGVNLVFINCLNKKDDDK